MPQALALAGEVEAALQRDPSAFFAKMYGDQPDRWSDKLAGPERLRFVVNFHRGPMFGRGHGHFSPILAYLAGRDLVLVGDVNHDYGLYLVSASRLFDAMNTIDSVTGKKRGLLMVTLG